MAHVAASEQKVPGGTLIIAGDDTCPRPDIAGLKAGDMFRCDCGKLWRAKLSCGPRSGEDCLYWSDIT